MKNLILGAFLPWFVGAVALAQAGPPPPDAKPASSNVPGAQFLKIDSERRACFRIKAPDAKEVSPGLPGSNRVIKGDDGVWTVTTDPLALGFRFYSITVDEVTLADPTGESYFGGGKTGSGIEVPSPGEDFYLPKQAPRGDIRAHHFFAKSTGKVRRCFVFTPSGYETDLTARHPVLYLQHGIRILFPLTVMAGSCIATVHTG
jgi:hypothetical protein